jgi:hypothetical protein
MLLHAFLRVPKEKAALLKELGGIIGGDRYFMSPRIKTLKAIRAKIRPEPAREPLPPPPKRYTPPRLTAKQRRAPGALSCPDGAAAPYLPARFRSLIKAGCCSVSLLKFAELCSRHKIHTQLVDVFAPAALGAVLNDMTISCLRCRVVCGGANNQLAEVRHDAALAVRSIVFVRTIWRMPAASSTSIRKPSTTSPPRCSLR